MARQIWGISLKRDNPELIPHRLCFLLILTFCSLAATASAQAPPCPTSPSSAPGKDFHGQTLVNQNFAYQDLVNANFANATLTGTVFIGTNLTGANFSGATFNGNVSLPTDFTLATLTSACFMGAKFTGLTYFTYATLTSADFSHTDISKNAVFGKSPLNFNPHATPRLAFRSATMNCEFLADWQRLDLSGATVTACAAQLAKQDFSGTDMSGVTLSNLILTDTNFSGALLYGAQLNGANLDGANLGGAYLTNNPSAGITEAANLAGTHLKNVNLTNAHLAGASFVSASFYGTVPVGQGTCDTTTGTCASAAGADLTGTRFSEAYLYGVDFTNTTIKGTEFDNAVLIGANFTGAQFSVDPTLGTDADFTAAFLQGTILGTAELNKTVFQDAFVDFRAGGNDLYLDLDGTHTKFPGWPQAKQGQAVCVFVFYSKPTTVPTNNTTLTCPDGSVASSNTPPGCGPTDASPQTHWDSPVSIAQASPRASYLNDATYTKKAAPICTPADSTW